MWDENNVCLSWDDTLEYAAVPGLEMVPAIYRGLWSESNTRSLEKRIDTKVQEGYTVRLTDSFSYGSFRRSIAKWVRNGHVQTTHNWKMRLHFVLSAVGWSGRRRYLCGAARAWRKPPFRRLDRLESRFKLGGELRTGHRPRGGRHFKPQGTTVLLSYTARKTVFPPRFTNNSTESSLPDFPSAAPKSCVLATA
jgi:hypothetical protein